MVQLLLLVCMHLFTSISLLPVWTWLLIANLTRLIIRWVPYYAFSYYQNAHEKLVQKKDHCMHLLNGS